MHINEPLNIGERQRYQRQLWSENLVDIPIQCAREREALRSSADWAIDN